MGVNIDVDLDVDISDEIANIKSQLESIDDDVDISVGDIDVNGSDGDGDGGDGEARLLGKNCCNRIVRHIQSLRDTIDTGNVSIMDWIEKNGSGSGGGGGGGGDDDSKYPLDLGGAAGHPQDEFTGDDSKLTGTIRGFDFDSESEYRKIRTLTQGYDELGDSIGGVWRHLSKLKPSMRSIYSIIALSIPLIIGFGAELAGLATVIASVGAAGAAVAGIGLLGGEADSLSGSVKNAQQKLKEFKKDLFQIFEPVADQFAPITAGLFDGMLSIANNLTDEISGLSTFAEVFGDVLGPVTNLLENTVQVLLDMAPALKQATFEFFTWLTNNFPPFFRGLIETGLEAKDVIRGFGNILYQTLRIVLEVSTFIVQLISAFQFLAPILEFVADLFSNRFFRAIMLFIGMAGILITLMYKFAGALMAVSQSSMLATLGAKGFLASLKSTLLLIPRAIGRIWAFNAALGATAALVTLITGGLAAIGAVMGAGAIFDTLSGPNMTANYSGPGRPGGSETTINDHRSFTINNEGGDDSLSSYKSVEHAINRSNATDTARSRPPINTSDSTSDS